MIGGKNRLDNVAPLDHENPMGRLREKVEVIELVPGREPIDVGVDQGQEPARVLPGQDEGGADHRFLDAESGGDATGEQGFARPQRPGEHNHVARSQQRGQPGAEVGRITRMRAEERSHAKRFICSAWSSESGREPSDDPSDLVSVEASGEAPLPLGGGLVVDRGLDNASRTRAKSDCISPINRSPERRAAAGW